jgi:hypothetical protein
MAISRYGRSAVAVVAAALALTGAAAAAASAEAAAHGAASASKVVFSHARYHLTYRHLGIEIMNVDAGRAGTWAIGYRVNAHADATAGLLLHYTGGRWVSVSFPGQSAFSPLSVTALAPGDFWLFGYLNGTGAALHYLNGVWSPFPLPPQSTGAWLVLSDTDIWTAGGQPDVCASVSSEPDCTPASHWNGAIWQSYPVPVDALTSLAGTSATDIWAAGYDGERLTGYAPAHVLRWTGSAFTNTSLVARSSDYIPLLTVLSARNVWLGGSIPRSARGSSCISHWNGRRWSAFSFAVVGDSFCDNLVSDGHRGVWTGPEVDWTGSEFVKYDHLPQAVIQKGSIQGTSEGVTSIPGSPAQWVFGYLQRSRHGKYLITGYIDRRG